MTHVETGLRIHKELGFSLPDGVRDYVQKLIDELELLDILLDVDKLPEEVIKSNCIHILLKFWNTKEWQDYVVEERRRRTILPLSKRCEESRTVSETSV